jgi:hypothetical protein
VASGCVDAATAAAVTVAAAFAATLVYNCNSDQFKKVSGYPWRWLSA